VCKFFEKFHSIRATLSTGNNKETMRYLSARAKHRSKCMLWCNGRQTFDLKALSMFDDDKLEEAKQGKPFTMRNQLRSSLLKCK
jgi:hypothetical protein